MVYHNKISAEVLRDKATLKQIPSDMPGYYKWWASEDDTKKLLLNQSYWSQLRPALEQDENGYYCVYVGIAVKESLMARLNWHINQNHTKSAIGSGTLSTLRNTITSLLSKNLYEEDVCNKLMNNMFVEYFLLNLPIGSDEARREIDKIEDGLINGEFARPLNIQGNHNIANVDFKYELKCRRKISKKSSVATEKL